MGLAGVATLKSLIVPLITVSFNPSIYLGTALGASIGGMVTHDENVTNRIKENIETRIQEFKKQQENKTGQ